jgi:predicted nicotinamide N-methyase
MGWSVLGYAQWVTAGSLSTPGPRLLIEENFVHTGTRIWAGAWLHRKWAAENSGLFRGHSVLEVGAGCGLLGLSVAVSGDAPTSVALSDFRGHFESAGMGTSVMHLLQRNIRANESLTRAAGVEITVLELDWQRPTEPLSWCTDAKTTTGATGSTFTPVGVPVGQEDSVRLEEDEQMAPCSAKAVDLILGTEVLYEPEGARLLAALLPTWLAKPHGTGWFLSNAKRSGVTEFVVRVKHASQYMYTKFSTNCLGITTCNASLLPGGVQRTWPTLRAYAS